MFQLTSCVSFTDTSSSYEQNAALEGGVFYLDGTPSTFTSTTFTNNWAQKGGTFYLAGQLTLSLANVIVTGSSSTLQGGVLYANEPTNTKT